MTVGALDDEIARAREAIRALRHTPPGETVEQARARSGQIVALSRKLVEVSRGVVSDAVTNVLDEKTVERRADGKTERRAFAAEVRAKGRRLEGYAATFGAEARIADFVETIAPGAFADSLASGGDVLALVDHDASRVLARTKSKTLRLSEDLRGLAFDLDVPATTAGNDVLALAERGDLGGASFAFTVKRDRWDGERRTLESVDLHEVSIVQSWPAYPDTLVQARSRPVFHPRLAVARRYLESL
jgi:HK97 family phage prohead protease